MSEAITSRAFGTKSELALISFMVMILLVLFTPIPAGLLDFLLIANFTLGMMILLLTFYMDKPIGFSTFPAVLLIATLFRLSLNIAATRLILGDSDAGAVIGAIGSYVVGGNYVIGLVVFLILIVVQYIVVTSGAQRVAEVAARFTLDSMPGKQMSIDADLNMGLIDEKQAQQRRSDIEREANFYGSMDGASKFVKGDAIAGIVIILIDIIGGLSIGIAQKGMSWGEALHTYTLLTVGDGIVTQIPALIISTATGIIVTRAASDAFFGEELGRQIGRYPKTLVMAGTFLFAFMWLPGIPLLPILSVITIVWVAAAYNLFRHTDAGDTEEQKDGAEDDSGDIYNDIAVEPIEIIVGSGLGKLFGGGDVMAGSAVENNPFMEKVKAFRKQFAFDMGFVFPSVRLRDDVRKADGGYEIRIFDTRVAEGELQPGQLLAISAANTSDLLQGVKTRDPTYGLPAIWISEDQRSKARELGYTLVDPITVMITHFSEVIRNHAQELLTRGEIDRLVKRVKDEQPALCEELVPAVLRWSDVQKILQNLLKERVSIRNISAIIEVLVDKGKSTQSHDELSEAVRQKLGRVICGPLQNNEGELKVMTFAPGLEQQLQSGLQQSSEAGSNLVLDPVLTERVFTRLGELSEKMMGDNFRPVLLCSPGLRRHIRKLTARLLPHLSVLALTEIPETIAIKSYDIVNVERTHTDKNRPVAKQSSVA